MKKLLSTITLLFLLKLAAYAQCDCYTVEGLAIVGQDSMELVVTNACDDNVYLNLYVISSVAPFDTLGRQEIFNAFFLPFDTPVSQILSTDLTSMPALGTYRVSITNGTLACDSLSFSPTVPVTDLPSLNPFTISPNPFSEQTIIQCTEPLSNAVLTLYNTTGVMVRRVANLNGEIIMVKRENLLSGMYYISLMEGHRLIINSRLFIK